MFSRMRILRGGEYNPHPRPQIVFEGIFSPILITGGKIDILGPQKEPRVR